VRTFVALNLPAAERRRLYASLEPLRRRPLAVRWASTGALHLTLKFLGDIEGGEVARIGEALRRVAGDHAPLDLDIGGIGAFPSLRRAAVLWVGVAAAPPLLALQAAVELALSRLGYAREQRPFRPHITVARTRGGARPPDVERLLTEYEYRGAAHVASVDLMRSHTYPDGARYEVILRAALVPEPEVP
jgi:RNA 2',3'-cyclic 3'-phosphodiesterase